MFARVITAQIDVDGLDRVLDVARRELPTARDMSGFAGYFVLTDAERGDVMVISLWETHEQMAAVAEGQPSGIRRDGSLSTDLSAMTLRTYDVALHA